MTSVSAQSSAPLRRSVQEAFESRKSWALWMQNNAKSLEIALCENDGQDITCNVCNVSMYCVQAHLCGQKHYKKLWECVHHHFSEPCRCDEQLPALEQVFEVSGNRIVFDHITGNFDHDVASAEPALKVQKTFCDGDGTGVGSAEKSKPQQHACSRHDIAISGILNLAGTAFSSKDGLVHYIYYLETRCRKVDNIGLQTQDHLFLFALLLASNMQHLFCSEVRGFKCAHAEYYFVLVLADGSERQFDWRECVHNCFKVGPLVLPPCIEAADLSRVADIDVPIFDTSARGGPHEWNQKGAEAYWGRKVQKSLKPQAATSVDIDIMLRFLHVREGPEGLPILSKLGRPIAHEHGWFRLHWMPLTLESMTELATAGWRRAWHGCKLEGLYSILYHGRLQESHDESTGDRYLAGMPGVYAHKDATFAKAENYIRFVDLLDNGVLWAVKLELLVDRTDAVKAARPTDQWAQPSRSVRIVALWICGRLHSDMRDGDAVSLPWNPKREANPRDERWSRPEAPRFQGELAIPSSTQNDICIDVTAVGSTDSNLDSYDGELVYSREALLAWRSAVEAETFCKTQTGKRTRYLQKLVLRARISIGQRTQRRRRLLLPSKRALKVTGDRGSCRRLPRETQKDRHECEMNLAGMGNEPEEGEIVSRCCCICI